MTSASEARSTPVRILTPAGYVSGALHLPNRGNLVDLLNRGDALLRLTDVVLPSGEGPVGFFALQRAAAILVAPQDSAEQPPTALAGTHADHRTWWLLQGGVEVEGTLRLLQGVRISDHLLHRTGFVILRQPMVRIRKADGVVVSAAPGTWVAMQAAAAVGASEIA